MLQLISEELTNHEIGEKLYMSPRTVEGYRLKMVQKAGVKSTVGLVLYALKNGFLNNVNSHENAFA